MAKKIYDIKPPKGVIIEEDDLKELEKESKKNLSNAKAIAKDVAAVTQKRSRASQRQPKKEKKSIWKPIIITILIILFVVAVYLFFKLPKAEIVIWPKVETLSFKQTITADKSVEAVDNVKNVIPAKYLQVTKANSQDFPATGNATDEGKASGNITIYNKFDPVRTFTFKEGTRFMSDSGKIFVTFQKVVIPAAKKVGSKITPGTVQIQVQAIEGGDSYNIAPAAFSVPGLKGTSFYYSISAKSTEAMTGGYSGKVKKVTADDIQTAKDVLTEKTTADAISDLKNQVSSEYIVLDNAILPNVTKASTSTKVGATAEKFNYQVTVVASAVAFKKADLEQFVKSYIASQMQEGKTLLEEKLKIDYSASLVDVSGGKATLNLDFSSGVYKSMDKHSMQLLMLGRNDKQIRETINNVLGSEVSNVEIKFWPFWVSSAPKNQKAVNIDLKFQ